MDVYGVEFPCSAPTNKSVYVKITPELVRLQLLFLENVMNASLSGSLLSQLK